MTCSIVVYRSGILVLRLRAVFNLHGCCVVVIDLCKLKIITSGVAQWLACWAHNPKVHGSRPFPLLFKISKKQKFRNQVGIHADAVYLQYKCTSMLCTCNVHAPVFSIHAPPLLRGAKPRQSVNRRNAEHRCPVLESAVSCVSPHSAEVRARCMRPSFRLVGPPLSAKCGA